MARTATVAAIATMLLVVPCMPPSRMRMPWRDHSGGAGRGRGKIGVGLVAPLFLHRDSPAKAGAQSDRTSRGPGPPLSRGNQFSLEGDGAAKMAGGRGAA